MVRKKGRVTIVNPNRKDLLEVFKDKGVNFHEETGNFMYCPTGEPYLTVVSGGVKKEGAGSDLFESERAALTAWNNTICKIVADLEGKLTVYWRKMPEMMFFGSTGVGLKRWSVYSRFRVSNMPVIQSADYKQIEQKEE